MEVAEGLRCKLEALIVAFSAQIIHVTASYGVALLTPTDSSFSGLIARADQALYQAKSSGRNKVAQHGVRIDLTKAAPAG